MPVIFGLVDPARHDRRVLFENLHEARVAY